jgi:peptide/nickel transport system permease protein
MLNENYGMAIGGKPLLALIPALAIMIMVLAFNLIGNGLRDALDVKTKL